MVRRGINHHFTKLTEADVLGIRAAREAKVPFDVITEQYGITKTTIWNICTRRTWRHLPPAGEAGMNDILDAIQRRYGIVLTSGEAANLVAANRLKVQRLIGAADQVLSRYDDDLSMAASIKDLRDAVDSMSAP
jgi:hypothetical protein